MAKLSSPEKIPRPMNCFLAFRLEKQNEIVARCPGANHRDISKIIAKWWRETPEEEKKLYRERATQAKLEHAKLYPNYKYQPQKKNGRNTRKYARRPQDKFTSRKEENNRIMEILYTCRRNASGTPLPSVNTESETYQLSANSPSVDKKSVAVPPALGCLYGNAECSPVSSNDDDFLSSGHSSPHSLPFAQDAYIVPPVPFFSCDTFYPDGLDGIGYEYGNAELSFPSTALSLPIQQFPTQDNFHSLSVAGVLDPLCGLSVEPINYIDPSLTFFNYGAQYLTTPSTGESGMNDMSIQAYTDMTLFTETPSLGYPMLNMDNTTY